MQRVTRTVFAAAVLATLGVASSAARAQDAPFKIGVFDPQRVSEETGEGKRIQVALGQLRDQRQKEIQADEAKIAEMQQQFESQAASLSAERRQAMEIDIQRRLLELNSRKDVVTRGFQLEVSAAEAGFNDKLRVVIGQFAKDEGFTLILEASTVAFASAQIDVTTGVIDTFNRMFPPKTE